MKLYRYRSIKRALAEIEQETFCFSSTEKLNDPIEGYVDPSFIEKNIPYNYKQNIAWANIQVNFPKLYVEQLYDVIYPNGYVICFSTDETNSAMWGNYAQNHQGICFIYETQEISGKNYLTVDSKKMEVKPVRYGSDVIERNFFTSLGRLNPKQIKSWLSSVDETTSKLFDTFSKKNIKSWLMQYRLDYVEKFHRKNSAWQHEKEYRILLPDDYYYQYDEKEYRCLKYEPLALKGIIFGINTPIDNKFKIIQKIQQAGDKFRHVEFFQAEYECDTQKIYVRQKKYP